MKQQLRGSIPTRGNVLCVWRSRSNFSGKPEIAYFDIIIMTKDVFRLEVTMEVAVLMQASESCCDFKENPLYLMLRKCSVALQCSGVDLIEVAFQIVKDEEEFRVGEDDFSQFDDVGVLEFLETLDLLEHIAVLPGLVLTLHFFDGHDLVVRIHGLKDHSIGAVPNGLHYLILLHNKQL